MHFVIDDRRAERIQKAWAASDALDDVTLELIDCPDRRLANAALDYAIRTTEKPDVELKSTDTSFTKLSSKELSVLFSDTFNKFGNL